MLLVPGRFSSKVLSCFNCLSAGIFLAMSMTHLFPEALKFYESTKSKFPLPTRCFLLGYQTILLLSLLTRRSKKPTLRELPIQETANTGVTEENEIEEKEVE